MLDVLVDDDSEFDEHVLLFVDDGGIESSGAWELVVRRVRRLPAGQDFVIKRTSERPCAGPGPCLEHWYDGLLQDAFTGSDDLVEWLEEFITSKRRIRFVRATKTGH